MLIDYNGLKDREEVIEMYKVSDEELRKVVEFEGASVSEAERSMAQELLLQRNVMKKLNALLENSSIWMTANSAKLKTTEDHFNELMTAVEKYEQEYYN